MKKLVSLFLALMMCASLAACGGGGSDSSDSSSGGDDNIAGTVTDDALKPLANAYNDLANKYNEVYAAAEANGWLDDEVTSAELDAVYGMVTYVGSGLTDDPSKLEETDLDAAVEQLQQFLNGLDEVAERVSVPYEG